MANSKFNDASTRKRVRNDPRPPSPKRESVEEFLARTGQKIERAQDPRPEPEQRLVWGLGRTVQDALDGNARVPSGGQQ